jgi:pimeloyl-ACP methyl ester carboxylesterase
LPGGFAHPEPQADGPLPPMSPRPLTTMRTNSAWLLALVLLLVAGPDSLQAQESNFFTASDGVRIHYLTAGDQGSWVVLIHGFTDSAQRMWFSTGIAPDLALRHRVVAIDLRNHGQSDRPQPNGVGRAEDVIELMAHLGIDRAHVHGYSMGGAITRALLASHPERFITAGFGGSGIREEDAELNAIAAGFDRSGPTPTGAAAAAFENLRTRAAANSATTPAGAGAGSGGLAGFNRPIDLTRIEVPVIAINGEFDAPFAKTMRLWRELRTFQNVVLPGHNHMTAIAVGAPMPPEYLEATAAFITAYDHR